MKFEPKYANCEIMDIRQSDIKIDNLESFKKLAKPTVNSDGYLYVQVRAISSRVNKNHDGWPSEELAKSYKTFEGRPIFVDHNNDDPERTRGYIKAAMLHVEDLEKASAFDPYYATAPDNHKPPTWIELLLEVDAKSFPKLAKAILNGDIDSVSMGSNISISVCSVCGRESKNPLEYCSHIKSGKGQEFEITSSEGQKQKKMAYEDCHGINFFEISFVFDPADDTALIQEIRSEAKVAAPHHEPEWLDGSWLDDGHVNADGHRVHEVSDLGKCPSCKKGKLNPLSRSESDNPYSHKCDHCGYASTRGSSVKETTEVYDQENDPTNLEHSQKVPDAPVGRDEDAQVRQWRLEQFTRIGFPPEIAQSLADGQLDYHDLEHLIQQGASPDQAHAIMASKKKTSLLARAGSTLATLEALEEFELDTKVSQIPGTQKEADDQGGGYSLNDHSEREINHIPQSDQLTAPQDVDTLRAENECPKCGTEMDNDKTVGAPICSECGFIQPATGLDSPDLSLHHRLLNDAPKPEAADAEPAPVVEDPGANAPSTFIAPISPLQANSKDEPNQVISEMKFTTKSRFVVHSGEEIDALSAVDKKVLLPDPKKKGTDEPQGKIISDQLTPVETNTKETTMDKTTDRETIKRVEEDGQGVKRTEEIIREHGPMGDAEPSVDETDAITPTDGSPVEGAPMDETTPDDNPAMKSSPEPEKKEENDGKPKWASETHLFTAFKLAKFAVEVGVIDTNDELQFVAKVESETPAEIQARFDTLQMVKDAGLGKKKIITSRRGLPPMPKTAATLTSEDEVPFEALFSV